MNAHPVLLQKKYVRVISLFAEKNKISLNSALDFFYKSKLYPLLNEGISDFHCRSDIYIADMLSEELKSINN